MAAIVDLSNILNKATTSGSYENLHFYKDARSGSSAVAATVVGRISSLWTYNGIPSNSLPISGTESTNRITTGSLRQRINSGSSDKWLTGVTATSLNAGSLHIYDRILHNGGLSGTSILSQSIDGVLTRNVSGSNNEIFIEIYDTLGSTGTTVVVEYTNQDGIGGRLTPLTVIGGTGFREAQRMIKCPLQSPDTGVRSVQNVKLTATTGTAGSFGITISNPITVVYLSNTGTGGVRDFISQISGPVQIEPDACIAFYWLAQTTAAPQIYGSIHFIDN